MTWGKEFLLAILFLILLMGIDFSVKGAGPVMRGGVRLVFALVVAGIVFYVLGTMKIFEHRIKLGTFSKIWGFIFGICLGGLFLLISFLGHTTLMMHSKTILADSMMALSAGIFEELLCRGLLLSGFLSVFKNAKYKFTEAALASGIFFGLFHFLNLTSGQSFLPTLQQATYAFVIGAIFASIRLTTNTLTWVILIHALIDWQPGISVTHLVNSTVSWPVFGAVWGIILVVTVIFLTSFDGSYNHQETLNSKK
ncbi:metal-dependent membrane protease [Lentilactobacillus otakiensis DSM 19908 = JCM 15040]|uniref:Metal-dependent membrane protease n=2 Tax=Lentilactobacillus otakiensis TaxID=481720 RepID=S4NCD0_9LACO|nr:metal-dependent membrane protease [Lentilactobacillus otakiensis DSM 19908 = JCM 15040]